MSADVVLHALGLEEFQLLEVVENKEKATLVHMFANTMTYVLDNLGFFDYLDGKACAIQEERAVPRRSPYRIVLSETERRELERLANKYTAPYYLVVRAKLVLMAADGLDNKTIGERLSLPRQVVTKWRKRFFEERLAGLQDKPRPGRPPAFSPQRGRSGQGSGV